MICCIYPIVSHVPWPNTTYAWRYKNIPSEKILLMFEAMSLGQGHQAVGLRVLMKEKILLSHSPLSKPEFLKRDFLESLHWKQNWEIQVLPLVVFGIGMSTELPENPPHLSFWQTSRSCTLKLCLGITSWGSVCGVSPFQPQFWLPTLDHFSTARPRILLQDQSWCPRVM